MVKAPLVTPDATFGEEVLRALDKAGFQTNVALWLKEGDIWTLLLSAPAYEKLGPTAAYRRLIEALSAEGPAPMSDFPIRLEGNRYPLIKGLRKTFGKTSSVEGMRLGKHAIGGVWIDDAYVYRIK